jgi:hypothetical protein
MKYHLFHQHKGDKMQYSFSDKRNDIAKKLKEIAEMLESQTFDFDNPMINCELNTEINLHEYNNKICTKRIILDITYEENLK